MFLGVGKSEGINFVTLGQGVGGVGCFFFHFLFFFLWKVFLGVVKSEGICHSRSGGLAASSFFFCNHSSRGICPGAEGQYLCPRN